MKLALEAWRELGRTLDLEEAVQKVTALMEERMPVHAVLVRSLDLSAKRLSTIATGVSARGAVLACTRRDLTETELSVLLRWCMLGQVTHLPAGQPHPIRQLVLPTNVTFDALIGPLRGDAGPIGMLVILASATRKLSTEHARLTQELLEPFSSSLASTLKVSQLDRERRAMEADNDALLTRLQRQDIADTIVGEGSGLKDVLIKVDQVAPTDAPVLILGETGTGKEVIARTIHSRSRRRDGPMFRVNCGAIPPELVDSELFGHERGSFTGATNSRKGWFERADGGTLFLDEVGELPLAAQVRLLRVLQDGTLERVGGQRTLTVDVRVVAATNANLEGMVRSGSFRDDLWYRISVFPLRLPPLRDRPEDIPDLAAHFAWRSGKRLGGTPLVPSPDDIHLLVGYDWPGNVRELNTVIERAAIIGDGKRLEIAQALGGPTARFESKVPPSLTDQASGLSSNERFLTLEEVMERHIIAALEHTAGRIEGPSGAAKMLDINPHTLRARMRKMGLDWNRFRQRGNEEEQSASDLPRSLPTAVME